MLLRLYSLSANVFTPSLHPYVIFCLGGIANGELFMFGRGGSGELGQGGDVEKLKETKTLMVIVGGIKGFCCRHFLETVRVL